MKIIYGLCSDKKKLFSWHGHDYQTHTTESGVFNMLDGGCSSSPDGYSRYGGEIKLQESEISEIITDIRESFQWGQNYTKNNEKLSETKWQLLKDLTTDHIIGILKYFTEKLQDKQEMSKEWKIKHLIFLEELQFRLTNKIF